MAGITGIPVAVRVPLPLADGTRGVLAEGVADAEAAVEALGLPVVHPDSVAVGVGVGVTVGVTLRVTGGGAMLEGRDGRVERNIKVPAPAIAIKKKHETTAVGEKTR